ncbi:LEVG family PEP-CTERM protein [Fortiea contorta]|uniref:LEVG family PEP-CTERM protein n=1 Tax=Fortiea contorta TaxID=1892405 RepID=UPI00034C68CB|nr:LEVG family PEP-CTERM protein [Fortiea contorta]
MLTLKSFSKVIAASTIGLSVLSATSAAHAVNLVPQQEGEIKLTNLACLSETNPKCIDTSLGAIGYKVTSLNYDSKFSVSRLFSDKRGTANDYSAFGIKFSADDEGTNPNAFQEYWLRPVAYEAATEKIGAPRTTSSKRSNLIAPPGAVVGTVTATLPSTTETTTSSNGTKTITTTSSETITVTSLKNSKLVQEITTKKTTQATTITPGKAVENGRLEVGRFQFDFNKPLAGLEFSFFDVEESNYTGILSYVNGLGKTISIKELLTGGKDGNRQSLMLKDVQSFIVQLGNPGKKYGNSNSKFSTGDGANLQLETVPEPGAVAGLSALAVLGMMSKRQRRNKAA